MRGMQASTPFRIASAFPGRIRLQFAPAYGDNGRLRACADRVAALAGVQAAQVVPEARSVIVRYVPTQRQLESVLDLIQRIAIESARLPVTRQSRSRDAGTASAAILSTDSRRALKRAASPASQQRETLSTRNLAQEKPRGLKALFLPSVAVAFAATELFPVAVTGALLAMAVVPIAQRAARGVRRRQVTTDELDLANIALLALQERFLTASGIAWLISLGEFIRGQIIRYSRQEAARQAFAAGMRAGANAEEALPQARAMVEQIANAPLSDTTVYQNSVQVGDRLAYPLFGVAALGLLLRRDPRNFIGIIKPGRDFASAMRFGAPMPVLSAMTAGSRQGVLIRRGEAVERLAQVNAVVFVSLEATGERETLPRVVEGLLERGVTRFVLPTQESARVAQAASARYGRPDVLVEALSTEPTEVVQRLRDQGHIVAVVINGRHGRERLPAADVTISLTPEGRDTQDADILLTGSLESLLPVIDVAREAMDILQQNTAIAAGASAFNLATALLRVGPPPLSTLINTSTVAAIGINALRPLRGGSAVRTPAPRRLLPVPT